MCTVKNRLKLPAGESPVELSCSLGIDSQVAQGASRLEPREPCGCPTVKLTGGDWGPVAKLPRELANWNRETGVVILHPGEQIATPPRTCSHVAESPVEQSCSLGTDSQAAGKIPSPPQIPGTRQPPRPNATQQLLPPSALDHTAALAGPFVPAQQIIKGRSVRSSRAPSNRPLPKKA